MKKNLNRSLLFLLFLGLLICTVQYSIDYCYRKRVSNKFTRLLTHATDANIMIFGSSVAYHQFDPRPISQVTGKSVYNMGWPGMFFIQYNGLIKEYLTYGHACSTIVITCDFDNLGRNNLITRPDLFYAYLGNGNLYQSLHELEPTKIMLAKYVPGYKLTLLNKPFYTDLMLASHPADTLSGYEPLDMPWEQTRDGKPFNTRYDETVFLELKATIAAILAKGIRVILVIPPVYREGYQMIQNAPMIKSKYQSLVRDSVFFLDYTSDTLCGNKGYFRNFTHLNTRGATLFSYTFAHDLEKIIHE